MEKISIVIPTYNSEKYIKRCVDSVRNQLYENIEILIIDNGSTDNTQQICEEYAKKDRRIKNIQSNRFGVSAARNIGLEHATGKYIQFLDSDDAIKPNMISCLYEKMTSTNADVVICGYDYVREDSIEKHMLCNCSCDKKSMMVNYLSQSKYEGVFNYLWNKLYKRERIEEGKVRFDENITLAEDALFNMELYSHCKNYTFIDACLYLHYDNEESLEKQPKDIYTLRDTYFEICLRYEKLYICEKMAEKYQGIIGNKYLYYAIVLLDTLCIENKDNKMKQKFVKEFLEFTDIIEKISKADCYNMNYRIMKQLLKIKNTFLILLYSNLKISMKR